MKQTQPRRNSSSKRRKVAVLANTMALKTFLIEHTNIEDGLAPSFLLSCHGRGKGLPNADAVSALLQLLKNTKMSVSVNFDQVDQIMDQIMDICGTAATPSSVREWQEVIRVWERTQAGRAPEERERLHLYASAVSVSLASGIAESHGLRVGQGSAGKARKLAYKEAAAEIEQEDEVFELVNPTLCDLSWVCAIAGRYSLLGASRDMYIDPLMYARTLSSRKTAQGDNSLAMCAWRVEQDASINIDEAARPAVSALLDQFAVVSGATAAKQGGSKSKYILAHGGTKPSALWNNAFRVAHRSLTLVDSRYKLRLAPAALKAWTGVDAIDGNAVVKSYGLATTQLFFARRFPLHVLCDEELPESLSSATIVLWPCPRWWWFCYYCTPIMFSCYDSLVCGYVASNGKASQNHLHDDGSRADPTAIMMPEGEFYQSASQPMPGDSTDDGDAEELSTWNEARLRTKILVSTRKCLQDERGAFMHWIRQHIQDQLARVLTNTRRSMRSPFNEVLATW